MKNKNLFLTIVLITVFTGCGGGSSDNKNSQENNLSNNTKFIDDSEFQEGIESGKISLIDSELYKNQLKDRKKREVEFDNFIEKFKYKYPEVSLDMLKIPDINRSDIVKLSYGNYDIKVPLNNGKEMQTITLGEHYLKESFVNIVKTYPTYDNQLNLYEMLLKKLSNKLKKELELPSIDLIKRDNSFYTADKIKDLVKQIVDRVRYIKDCDDTESTGGDVRRVCPDGDEEEIIIDDDVFGAPVGYTSNYDDEIGVGKFKYDYNKNNCTYNKYGIFKNYKAGDWPLKWYLTSVKNQGHRGSCVAFAITAALETAIAVKYNKWTNLSEQALYNKMKFSWERSDYVEGYTIGKALNKWWLNPEGINDLEDKYEWWKIPFEREWEYNPSLFRIHDKKCSYKDEDKQFDCQLNNALHPFAKSCVGYVDSNNNILDTCSNSTHQSLRYCSSSGGGCGFYLPNKHKETTGFYPTSFSNIWDHWHPKSSIQRLKTFLDLKIPVMISINTPDQFYNPKNGFMSNNVTRNQKHGGHAVLVVGYINNKKLKDIMPSNSSVPIGDGGGYFIIKNSWGTCYGDGGYVYMPYNSLKESITEAYVIKAIDKKYY